MVPITHGSDSTFIPISIFHGSKEGPVLGITAGVHGYEYPPIMASQELIHQIDPTKLAGTIILVQIANLESFLGRSPFVNPKDGINLNRAFPGDPEGSLTFRIADFISTEVISKCDFFLDMHGGDASEDLMSYIAYYQHDEMEEISKQGRDLAMNMGFDHVVIFQTTEKDYMKEGYPSLYCSAEAFKQGIPSVDIECGKLGEADKDLSLNISQAVRSMLARLEMYEGEVLTPAKSFICTDRFYQSSKYSGIFYPLKESGDYIAKGMKLGYITDFFGNTLEEVFAENSGVILYMIGTPPINEGETLVAIGKMEE
ncbi:MAG: succinylglutamate desuccinylase/aspartoacylase family protein [Bacteroidota bacterium]